MNEIPEFLLNKIKNEYSKEEVNMILKGYSLKKTPSFRINTLKTDKEEILNFLDSKNIPYKTVSWYKDAIKIEEDNLRTYDIYINGKIYMQSLSSMLPVLFLNPKENESILDMAAAPGGKTTQISALTNNKALITAVEKNKIRRDRLIYNIKKQGAKKITVIKEDARNLDEFYSFDKILLDAPCSGSGTISENKFNNINEELISRSVETQKRLLNKAISLLKKDHEMIYSTCSILKEENENQLEELIDKNIIEIVPINLSKYKDITFLSTKIKGVICVCPSIDYEGFFIAKIRKK